MRRCCQILQILCVITFAGSIASFPAQKRQKKIIQGPVVPNNKNLDRAEPAPRNSIRVEIFYKKEYGYKYDSASSPVGPQSCGAFSVFANAYGSARPERSIPISRDSKMTDTGTYYVCSFLISGLPLDQAIKISVSFSDRNSPTEGWIGGSQPQPPPGQQRTILEPARTVTLTQKRPSGTLAFEMVYDS